MQIIRAKKSVVQLRRQEYTRMLTLLNGLAIDKNKPINIVRTK
jgi:hypothetical protein